MTDEERERRRQAIDAARATLERLRDLKAPDVALPPPLRDPLEKWREESDAITQARAPAKAELAARSGPAIDLVELAAASRPAPPDWSAIDARIQQALEQERRLVLDVVGETLGQLLNETRDEVDKALHKLQASADKLNGQVEQLREWQLTDDRSRVVDMPSPLSRRN